MDVEMTGVAVELVGVQREVGMCDRARLILVLVGMRVDVRHAVSVGVDVHRVDVVVVSGPISVGDIGVVLIRRIRVIAMAGIQMIDVRHIQVVVVRGGVAVVVVIAMAHIPVVRVRWLLNRAIQMARAGEVVVISVRGGVAVISVERIIEVIGMPGVGVVIESLIAMRVAVIAMIEVGVAMSVDVGRGVRVIGV